MKHVSFADAYVVYDDGERGFVAIILHDIGMCRELEWYRSLDYACV